MTGVQTCALPILCFDIAFSPVFDTTSPDDRAADKTGPGGPLRVFHSSEVLSELSPLRAAVAGQGYHYRRMRSSQYSLPRLLLDRLDPLCTLLLSFSFTVSGEISPVSAGGLRASSASLFPFRFIR